MAKSRDTVKYPRPSSNDFPVVGVGASAGGLEVFKRLIRAIPESSGMAYILVQHLEPNHESLLPEILQKSTSIPVEEVTDNVHVERDHIYIIPSNKLLTADDGRLRLKPRPSNKKSLPIDVFFTSLAEVHRGHAIGVVLSGTASDGTQGLKAIKDQGGLTFAQEPGSAAFPGMPQSAIDAGVVDFILSPEEIPLQLARSEGLIKPGPAAGSKGHPDEEGAFRQLLTLLRSRKGTDFTYYKQTTIRRRVNRRMGLNKIKTFRAYLDFFRDNTAEQDLLYHDLLIPVTGFFRDPDTYVSVRESLLPLLFAGKEDGSPLRIWIAGCSTGQETYSMAICLNEYLGDRAHGYRIQIFSTDVSERSIAIARRGIYSRSEVEGLSPEQLEKYFEKIAGSYQVNKSIRDLCVFAHHDFVKNPPFARMDLISCRNVLIYMEPFLQKRALSTFHYALTEKGYLLLGHSETTAPARDLFVPFDRKEKIYTRKSVPAKLTPMTTARGEQATADAEKPIRKEAARNDFQRSADTLLLSRFSPPGVVVNDQLDIVEFRGPTSGWLEPGPGKASLNILKLAREGLAFELRNAFHKARTSRHEQVSGNIPLTVAGKPRWVTIEVYPLPHTVEPYYLILFRDLVRDGMGEVSGASDVPGAGDVPGASGPENPVGVRNDDLSQRNQQLEKELASLRDDMRSFMEDQEAVIEELQSANEELLSGSEELQSLNEELETSKEEIQSTNEELTTLNQELFDRNEQLNLSRLYAESIIATIREPFLVLDRNMEVKSANRSYYERFGTSEEDTEGKSLYSLGEGQWDVPVLRNSLGSILSREGRIKDIEVNYPGKGGGDRILLLNAARLFGKDNAEQLILLAIEDITESRNREVEQKRFSEELAKQVDERTANLKEANAALTHSNENLEQFATIASHDLQEPLRKIRTFAAILNQKHPQGLDEQAKDMLQKINLAAERMSALIHDVLNFSKVLDASVFEITDLTGILQNVLRDFDLQIEEKHAVIHYDPLPSITAVPLQMNQLFYNLLGNALKFSRPDVPPIIDISSRKLPADELKEHPQLDSGRSYYEIAVSDHGIGIDPRFFDRIFQIFQRLNTKQHFEGTGVGLALCKRIIDNHRGEIYVRPNEGGGSRFVILLPNLPATWTGRVNPIDGSL
ncbi:MAG: chemotaxis protein CheB [Bacteroidota bacterium]|nr:chemotaxis protein CheB [Bacteroidota bacterium]